MLVSIVSFVLIRNSIAVEENLVFGGITVSPLEPTSRSELSFTVGVNRNITAEEVRIIVQECAGDLCFVDDFNVSMNYTYTCCMDFYETQLTLIHEGATQIKYFVKILHNGSWYNSNTTVMNLSIPVNNTPVIIPENRSMPGFELVALFLSAGLLLIRRHNKLKEKNK